MFLNNVTIKTTIFSLFISQIPRVHLAEGGSITTSDVKQRILLVDPVTIGRVSDLVSMSKSM